MSYRFDNLRLEKGMYNEAGRSFAQVLERAAITSISGFAKLFTDAAKVLELE